ncbi:MAG TPA: hypothetical protein VHO24_16065 [Opitutaceae bacterium]|nr:hypothetical protein [Opitutaceae bacterium]
MSRAFFARQLFACPVARAFALGSALLFPVFSVAAENAEAWRAVTRVRGEVKIEYHSWVDEQSSDGVRTTADTRETAQVRFLLELDRVPPMALPPGLTPEMAAAMRALMPAPEPNTHLSWRGESATITGSFRHQSATTNYGSVTGEADFTGEPAYLKDFLFELTPATGVWQILSPGILRERYQITYVSTGPDGHTSYGTHNGAQDHLFNGKVTGRPAAISVGARSEGQIDNKPTRGFTKVAQLRLWPEMADVEVEITLDGYDKWRPEGSIGKPTAPANHIIARATVVPKGAARLENLPAVKKMRFELGNTSNEPGVCLNWPLNAKDEDYDLRLAERPLFPGQLSDKDQASEVTGMLTDEKGRPYAESQIDSYDFGGRTSLRVICSLADGREIVGVMKDGGAGQDSVRLPKMNAGDWIADAWRKEKNVGKLPALHDEEKVEDQEHNGDGFTLYEEYRGWVEQGKHIEGDPEKKDFFVRNTIGADAKGGIALFERVSKLKVHSRLRASELSREKRLMNGNRRDAPQRVKQHGVFLEKTQGQGSFGGGTAGMSKKDADYAFRPGKVWQVRVEYPTSRDGLFSKTRSASYNLSEGEAAVAYDRGVAHELLHSVGCDHHGWAGWGWTRYFQSASDPGNPTRRARFVDGSPGRDDSDLTYGPYSRTMTPETLAKDLMREPSGTLLWEDTGQDIAESMAAAFERALAERRAQNAANPPSVDPGTRATRFAYYGKDAHFWRESDLFDSTVKYNPQFQLYLTREEPGGSCSGDELCLMRYYFANTYPAKGRKDTYYVVRPGAGANRAGLEVCKSPTGTIHNADSHTPQSRFGDAAPQRGNCFKYICPNDAIAPRKL